MTMQSRLHNVTQTLTLLQRITLILQAHQEGREPDPEFRRLNDPLQNKAFNRHLPLL